MARRLFAHLRQQWIGVVALLLVLTGGTAYALDGSNTVFSDDLVNGEVKGLDLGADSVGSGKVADGSVKNADLSTGASSSNTIADGGIQGVDVKNNTLSGAQVDESTLFNDNSLDGADIDESSLGLIRGSGSVRGRTIDHGIGIFSQVVGPPFWDPDLSYSLFYRCPGLDTPGPGTTDGLWRFQNETGQSINLIVDNGGPDPSFAGALADGATHDETAPFTGDHIVFSAQQQDRRIVTIEAFSFHRDNDCHIQLQVVATPSSPL